MKPDWKDAPEWANYLAQDRGGAWYWYELEPTLKSHLSYEWSQGGLYDKAMQVGDGWRESLERRP